MEGTAMTEKKGRKPQQAASLALAQPADEVPTILVNGQPKRIRPGQVVPPTTDLPEGWTMYNMGHGVFEAWPTAEHVVGHPLDNEAKRHVLDKLDKTYTDLAPTKEFPTRPMPKRLVVNQAWRGLFKHVQSWGDRVMIHVAGDDQFEGPEYVPQFRFEL